MSCPGCVVVSCFLLFSRSPVLTLCPPTRMRRCPRFLTRSPSAFPPDVGSPGACLFHLTACLSALSALHSKCFCFCLDPWYAVFCAPHAQLSGGSPVCVVAASRCLLRPGAVAFWPRLVLSLCLYLARGSSCAGPLPLCCLPWPGLVVVSYLPLLFLVLLWPRLVVLPA